MPKMSKEDQFARLRELYDFDESLVTRRYGDTGTQSPAFSPALPFSASHSPPSPYLLLAGFDEAGRGALAGPVVVGCVHFPFLALGAVLPAASELVSDVALFSSSDSMANKLLTPQRNVADKLLTLHHNGADELRRCEERAESSIDPEVSITDHVSPSINPSIAQFPDSSPLQSLNPSILQDLTGLDDSKRLTRRQREALLPRIKEHAIWGVGSASADEIDRLGIVPAVSLAARRAYCLMGLNVNLLLCDRGIRLGPTRGLARFLASDRARKGACPPQLSLLDTGTRREEDTEKSKSRYGYRVTEGRGDLSSHSVFPSPRSPLPASIFPPELSFTRGDARSLHIAAASILAKVTRDEIMLNLDRTFPGYGFSEHKGYGTAAHIAALRKLGPSPIHRRSFKLR